MAIMCIGQSAYDILVPMQDSIIENQKYRITDKVECGGGPALNSAYLCSLWGAEVYLVSRIGKDYYGDQLRKILVDTGVNIDYLIKDDLHTALFYVIKKMEIELYLTSLGKRAD